MKKSQTAEYRAWINMRQRCTPGHKYYIEGVKVCPEWASFEKFLADVGPRPSSNHVLARIHKGVDYYRYNVQWVPKSKGGVGRPAKLYEAFGKKQTLRQWVRDKDYNTGVSYKTLRSRMEEGMDMETALTTGKQGHGRFVTNAQLEENNRALDDYLKAQGKNWTDEDMARWSREKAEAKKESERRLAEEMKRIKENNTLESFFDSLSELLGDEILPGINDKERSK